jgi:hypothetical protein
MSADTADTMRMAYERILEVIETSVFTEPADGWSAHMVIAHLTTNDLLLAAAVEDATAYDNSLAVDETHLAQLDDVVGRLRFSSRSLTALVAGMTPDRAETEIPVTILDGPTLMVDQPMAIGRLVRIHAEVHLPSHLAQLEGLRHNSVPK